MCVYVCNDSDGSSIENSKLGNDFSIKNENVREILHQLGRTKHGYAFMAALHHADH